METSTLLLAIDTTTDQSGVALYDGECLDEISWTSCRDQTVNLLSEIDHQLTRWSHEISSVTALAVAMGPGRFNSLRVGMSVAKGLVLAQGIPMVGIGSLESAAWPYLVPEVETLSVVSAGRGRVVWQRFRLQLDKASPQTQPANTTFEELRLDVERVTAPQIVTGELSREQADALKSMKDVAVPPAAGRLGRAGSVVELGYRRFCSGDFDDPVTLEPIYLHGKQVVRIAT